MKTGVVDPSGGPDFWSSLREKSKQPPQVVRGDILTAQEMKVVKSARLHNERSFNRIVHELLEIIERLTT